MDMPATEKAGVILLAMGGPATTDDVPEYLYNIFSDRNIIRLPGGALFQKPFARMISKRRSESVKHHYDLIGGGSPLLKWTEAQKVNIEKHLAGLTQPFSCYVGMRYFHPFTDEAIRTAIGDGCRELVFVPLYPQYCRATTGSSFAVAREALKDHPEVGAIFIDDFHDNEDYIALLKEYVDANIADDEVLLFSAHSIPVSFVDDGDPYVDQVKKTAALAAGGREYHLSFQSRTGPVKWVGPDTIAEVRRLVDAESRKIFVVPISFVCDHIETMYEIDIELKQMVEHGQRIRRMPMFNDDPRFGRLLARMIEEKRRVGLSG